MLLIQELLRSGIDPREIDSVHGITARQSDDHLLWIFNYDDLRVQDRHAQIVKECRGLILESGTWNVVALPFYRFFNFGEVGGDSIDWTTARAYEKLDGSLITLFRYRNKWRIATREVIDATGNLPDPDPAGGFNTFADVVWPLLNMKVDKLPGAMYVFELVSPMNRVVTPYERSELALLTVRYEESDGALGLREFYPDAVAWFAHQLCLRLPKSFPVQSTNEVGDLISELDDTDEGFVVCDVDHNRIKMKSERYLEFSEIINNGKPQYWRMLRDGKGDDLLAIFPRYREEYERLLEGFNDVMAWADRTYLDNRDAATRKDFARRIAGHPMSWFIWQRYDGRVSVALEAFEAMKPEIQQHWLKSILPEAIKSLSTWKESR